MRCGCQSSTHEALFSGGTLSRSDSSELDSQSHADGADPGVGSQRCGQQKAPQPDASPKSSLQAGTGWAQQAGATALPALRFPFNLAGAACAGLLR